jgi:hypothetical protein
MKNPWRGAARDVEYRIVAGQRCPDCSEQCALRADRDSTRNLSLRRRDHPHAPGLRLGECDALYLLTGDEFDAQEALRLGLVQEVVPVGQQLERAVAIAETIAAQAPLGVRATLASARKALVDGHDAARRELLPTMRKLMGTEDAQEGVRSFLERRTARFTGR